MPTTNGTLCETCEQAFSGVLAKPAATTSADSSDDSIATGGSGATSAPAASATSASGSNLTPQTFASSHESGLAGAAAAEIAHTKSEWVRSELARAESARAVAAGVSADAAAKRDRPQPAKAATPVVIDVRPAAATRSRQRSRSMMLGGTALAIAAAISVVVGIRRLGTTGEAESIQPTAVTAEVATAVRESESPNARVASRPGAKGRGAANSSTTATTPARPKPLGRQTNAPAASAALEPTPSATIEAPAPVEAPAMADPIVVDPPRVAAPPPPPIGRYFEPADVDESPKVVTRVEPQLPGDLAGRPVNDIVVVRLLVSQSGHPFRVSLLRGSKAGSSLDEAVIAAVKAWTFLPARKRGEAVSCWYNVGVPLGRN